MTKIEYALENQEFALEVFLDNEVAFNKTSFEALESSLTRYAGEDTICRRTKK